MAAHHWRASFPWLFLLLSGCASASHSAWLREPEEGLFLGERMPNLETSVSASDRAAPNRADDAVVVDEAARPRARLSRTVTLGETTAPSREPSAGAASEANAAPVNVTVNNYVTAPAPVYYGGWVDRVPARAHGVTPRDVSPPSTAPRGGSPAPAVSWPSPPSYGPSFPFKSGPASPWR